MLLVYLASILSAGRHVDLNALADAWSETITSERTHAGVFSSLDYHYRRWYLKDYRCDYQRLIELVSDLWRRIPFLLLCCLLSVVGGSFTYTLVVSTTMITNHAISVFGQHLVSREACRFKRISRCLIWNNNLWAHACRCILVAWLSLSALVFEGLQMWLPALDWAGVWSVATHTVFTPLLLSLRSRRQLHVYFSRQYHNDFKSCYQCIWPASCQQGDMSI